MENISTKDVNVFPNPTKGKFSSTEIETGIAIIRNVAGKIAQTQTINSNQIDISDQSEGLYFIEVKSGSEVFTGRVIKQ